MNNKSILKKQFILPNGKIDRYKFSRAYCALSFKYKKLEEMCLDIDSDKNLYNMSKMLGFRDLYEPLHRPLSEFITDKRYKKKLVLIPRGHFKTSIGSVSYVPMKIVQNPQIKILIYSGLREKAKGMLSPIRNILSEHPRFIRRFGSFKGSKVWNKDEILVRQAERNQIDNTFTVETSGIDESVTSKHFDVIIFDDLVTSKNSKTLLLRTKLKDSFDEAVDSLLKPGGEILIYGTIWHFDDLYMNIIENDDYDNGGAYKIFRKSCWKNYKSLDNLWEQGEPLFPTFYTKKDLQKKEEDNESLFWKNWMNIPRVSKNKPLNYENIKTYKREERQNIINKIKEIDIIMDPSSGKKNDWNDSSACIATGKYQNRIFILKIIKEKFSTQELCEIVFEIANEFNASHFIHIEDAAEQIHLINYAKKELNKWKIEGKIKKSIEILEDIRPANRDKNKRIMQLKPFFNDGTIVFPEKEMWENKELGREIDMMRMLKIEMDQYPLGAHDDLLDVISYSLDLYGIEIEDYMDYSIDKNKNIMYNINQGNNIGKFFGEDEGHDTTGIFDRDLEDIIEI